MRFHFTPDNCQVAQGIIQNLPQQNKHQALLPLLDLAKEQAGGWLPISALDAIAEMADVPRALVYQLATKAYSSNEDKL